MSVSVQQAAFDLGDELAGFGQSQGAQDQERKPRRDIGAVVSFTGLVRDDSGALDHMLIEHYPGMTERAIGQIVDEAVQRWSLGDVRVIHRYGVLRPGDQIMMVATAARHRVAAFEAAEFLMDYLKSRAPFWKKEVNADGSEWVAAKDEDEDALSRW
jgi:molybdopterin synthase catalytic subunit